MKNMILAMVLLTSGLVQASTQQNEQRANAFYQCLEGKLQAYNSSMYEFVDREELQKILRDPEDVRHSTVSYYAGTCANH